MRHDQIVDAFPAFVELLGERIHFSESNVGAFGGVFCLFLALAGLALVLSCYVSVIDVVREDVLSLK